MFFYSNQCFLCNMWFDHACIYLQRFHYRQTKNVFSVPYRNKFCDCKICWIAIKCVVKVLFLRGLENDCHVCENVEVLLSFIFNYVIKFYSTLTFVTFKSYKVINLLKRWEKLQGRKIEGYLTGKLKYCNNKLYRNV